MGRPKTHKDRYAVVDGEKVSFGSLKDGDQFELYEKDGKPVAGGPFIALSDAYIDEESNEWCIKCLPKRDNIEKPSIHPIHPLMGAKVMYNVNDELALPAIVVKGCPIDPDTGSYVVNLQVFTNGDGGMQFVRDVPFVEELSDEPGVCYVPS